MTNSKAKGARGERELSKKLTGYGWPSRRTQQYCGAVGDADIIGLPGIHVECKRVERLVLDKAMDQAVSDCTDGSIPTVMHRKDKGEWLVTMRLDDWTKLYRSWDGNHVTPEES